MVCASLAIPLHSGLNAPPAAPQAFIPGVASEGFWGEARPNSIVANATASTVCITFWFARDGETIQAMLVAP